MWIGSTLLTVIKSLVVIKVIYVSSLMSIPKEIITELNCLLFKFLWNGTDEVTRFKNGKRVVRR